MEQTAEITGITYPFIGGGGEMGKLIRSYDWSNTELGIPGNWPQSLQATLNILLHSAFPMFLFWGEGLICFYNDAFRPSLGANGKHPAIGKKGRDVWSEIWDFIGPLIDQVMKTGKPVWYEDQLVPFYRNGRMEEIYWTFSYSPAYGDGGVINGVFVTCTETTQKVLMVKKLEESDKRFQNLVREATVGIAVLMGEQLIVDTINDAYAKLIGRRRQELIGRPIFNVVPETEECFRTIINNVRVTGKAVHLYDFPYLLANDGRTSEGYLDLICQPYKREDGDVVGVMVLCHDVTQQVIDRKKLELSDQRTRSLIESAPFPIAVYTGKEMRIQFANRAMMEVWGKGDGVAGSLISEVLPDADRLEVLESLDHVFRDAVPYHEKNKRVELPFDGKTKTFYFNYSFTPLFQGDGSVYGVMNTAADVTDLNIAKQKVEESQRNLRNIILKAPVAMCILKGENHVVEIANEKMLQLWGKNAWEVLNRSIFDGLPEVRHQGYEELLEKVYTTGQTYAADHVALSLPRDGQMETVFINFVYEAYRETENTISGVIAVATDVTPQVLVRQKIEEVVAIRTKELAEANSNLKRSNDELAQFAYIASHDLQEPIRKVSTFAQMLEKELGDVSFQSAHFIDKIKSSTERMLRLIRDVLAYSQVSKDEGGFKYVKLNEVMEGIKNDYELMIEQKHAHLYWDDLAVVEAIPLQMMQLFSNLISNALKFSRKDVDPEICITSSFLSADDSMQYNMLNNSRDYCHIRVSDNGIGFNEEYAEKIFNIFQRLHGRKEFEGTGIGLAMCKKIADTHNGHIYATSGENGGSEFHVILPLRQ